MQRDLITLLDDILISINEIESFLKDINSLSDYKKDTLRKRAVERNLEIIGEVVKKIPNLIREEYNDIPWRQIAGLRDFLAHGYFVIDDEIIWNTVSEHLDPFKLSILKIKNNIK